MPDRPLSGLRVGIFVGDGVEVIDFAAPFGVMAVARRFDPSIDVFLVGDTRAPVHTQGGMEVRPRYSLDDAPDMDAFVIPGGPVTRTEAFNERLLRFLRDLPDKTLRTSVCTGSWVLAAAGLLEGQPATSRTSCGPGEAAGVAPIELLPSFGPVGSPERRRIVDSGKVVTAGGIASGMELGFYLLERHGFDADFINSVAQVMEYERGYEAYRDDRIVPEAAAAAG
jgi:transcriptional regulator GlxA family with amidase domain